MAAAGTASSARTAYFAYGSNMDASTLAGRRGIAWAHAAPARVRGWRLAIDKPSLLGTGEAMATIVRDPAAEVWGVLYDLAAADLDHLELTEGVRIGHYASIRVDAEPTSPWGDSGHATVEAATLASDRREPGLRPTARYLGLLVAGAVAHGLPQAWISHLKSIATAVETPEQAAMRPLLDAAMRKLR